MSENNGAAFEDTTAVATETAPVATAEAPPAKPAKKAAKPGSGKKAAKAPAAKGGKKAAGKPAAKGGKEKAAPAKADGPKPLSGPQLRILKAMIKYGKPLAGKDLAEKAELDPTAIGSQAGYRDPEINDRPVHKNNLFNRGFAKIEKHDINGRDVFCYVVTAAGRKAFERATEK